MNVHIRMVEYFGGATALWTPDQLKSAITRPCRYEPGVNRTCEDLAAHYGAVVLPARPRKPRDKVFFPRDRARRALIERAPVAIWKWKEVSCHSLEELRLLRADVSLRKTVLRLTLDMRLPLHEYDEAVRILAELEGSLAAHPRVGVLMTERDRLRLDVTDASSFMKDLPDVLQSVVRRLEAKADAEPEKTERAIHHLYQLVREGH